MLGRLNSGTLVAVGLLAAMPAFASDQAAHRSANGSDVTSVEYVEDPTGEATFDQIRARTDWIVSHPRINLGLSASTFWLRLKIVNRESAGEELHLQFNDPLLQHVEVFVPDATGAFKTYRLGYLDPDALRNRFASPKLIGAASDVRDVDTVHYVRVKSPTPLGLSMSLLGTDEAFVEARDESWIFGWIYGIMLFMPFYNFVVFLFSRDRSFLILALFTTFLGATYFTVQGHVSVLFPEMNLFIKDRLNHVFGALVYVMMIALVRELLTTKVNVPRMDKVLKVLMIGTSTIPVAVLFGNHHVFAMLGLLLTVSISLVTFAVVIACLRRTGAAIFFLIGFSFFITGSIVFVMQQTGALPSTFWTVHAVHFGAIFEEAFLAFAVAFKIKSLNNVVKMRAEELEVANANLSAEMANREQMAKNLAVQRSIAIHASKMRAIGEVAASIAHQVNNPLAILRMKLDNITFSLEKLDVPADHRQKLLAQFDGAERNITRIAKITNSLLRLSRNSESEDKAFVPVPQIILEGLDTCIDRFEEHGVRVRQIGLDGVQTLELKCHSTDLSQVILNLVKNSYDAIHKVVAEPWIEVAVTTTTTELRISVTDAGSGIPEALRDKVMQPFFTTKGAGKGTGVGLSIAKDLTESSGGKLVLDTDCPHTRFVLIFPLTQCRWRAPVELKGAAAG